MSVFVLVVLVRKTCRPSYETFRHQTVQCQCFTFEGQLSIDANETLFVVLYYSLKNYLYTEC